MNLFQGINTLLGTSTNPLCHPDTKESGYLFLFYPGTYIIEESWLYASYRHIWKGLQSAICRKPFVGRPLNVARLKLTVRPQVDGRSLFLSTFFEYLSTCLGTF